MASSIPTRVRQKRSCAASSQPGPSTCAEHKIMSTAKLPDRLLEEVVIFENRETQKTGAQALAPDYTPRQPLRSAPLPKHKNKTTTDAAASLQHRIEQFLYYQSE